MTGGPDTDAVEERVYIRPKQFPMYEFRATPGEFYMAAGGGVASQMVKRFKSSGGRSDSVRLRRIVRLGDLERALVTLFSAEPFGFKAIEVLGPTTIDSYEVQGPQIAQNPEVQDAKARAKDLSTITVNMQGSADEMLRLQIAKDGTVIFGNYPGDHTSLSILAGLDKVFKDNSDSESVTVRR